MPSPSSRPGRPPPLARRGVCALVLACFFAISAAANADDAQNTVFTHRAEAAYNQARARYRSQMDNPLAAWNFARTCYDWADWATNKAQRAAIAREGIAACQQSLLFTNTAAAHYYMAMNMGQVARTEGLGALKLVRQMESEFLIADNLDSDADFAGPDRGLGLLCRDAPGWPMSIGNRSRSRKFLEQAVAIAPDYPENVLNLAESELMWGEKKAARKQMDALETLWPTAQKALTGDAWEQSWNDWSKRRDALQQKLDQ